MELTHLLFIKISWHLLWSSSGLLFFRWSFYKGFGLFIYGLVRSCMGFIVSLLMFWYLIFLSGLSELTVTSKLKITLFYSPLPLVSWLVTYFLCSHLISKHHKNYKTSTLMAVIWISIGFLGSVFLEYYYLEHKAFHKWVC